MNPTVNMKPLRILSYTIFFSGMILGVALAAITIWNGTEAISYFFNGAKHEPFNGLRCPVLIAPTEKGIVAAAFNNPTDEEDTFFTERRSVERHPRAGSKIKSRFLHARQKTSG